MLLLAKQCRHLRIEIAGCDHTSPLADWGSQLAPFTTTRGNMATMRFRRMRMTLMIGHDNHEVVLLRRLKTDGISPHVPTKKNGKSMVSATQTVSYLR